jgi:23S rRNA (uracil1939-C5)-methyltransferase
VQAVHTPGPARVLPGCPAFPVCGGCQWQHVAPPAQRDAKAAVVAEQLARLAGMPGVEILPTLAAPRDWGYRARITLVVEGRRAGYHRARSHALVEIDACPIADDAVSAHLGAARKLVATVRVALARVAIVTAPGGVVLVATALRAPGPPDLAAAETLLARHGSVRGAIVRGAGVRLVAGDPHVTVVLEAGLDLEVPADVFTQVNPEANRLLVATVLGFAAMRPEACVLDLYCGAGNFSLPLARRGLRVLGVERDPIAVDAARANAVRLGLTHAAFRTAAVASALADVRPGTVDTVVLDPPRAGAAEALPALATLRAPRILYVSCDPATLARDVRVLAAAGYRLERVQPVDLFPQTYHVESVAELRLT